MKKFSFSILAAALVVASAPAFADQPNGTLATATKPNDTKSNGSAVGQSSSQYIQNGQFISGNCNCYPGQTWSDQTTSPGSRAAGNQELLGHTSWPGL
jgi:hypothetical protein